MCVLGAGLIGGSVLRRLGPGQAFGWNRSPETAEAARAGGADVSTDLPAVLHRASEQDALVVVAVPMPAVPAVLDAVAEHAPGVALTDVVSVKEPVRDAVQDRGLLRHYVGGHPMAGTSQSGWAATNPDLFEGATWVVAIDTSPEPDPTTWHRTAVLAQRCGATVHAATSRDHDAAVARISHLPHVLAEALALSGAGGGDLALSLAAGSFRDGTRVAGTHPDLVRAICEPNRSALLDALDEALAELTLARAELTADGVLTDLVARGFAARTAYERAQGAAAPASTLAPGAPGWTAAALAAGRAGRAVRVAS